MKGYTKHDFPVDKARKFLEPGPIVLVSSRWKDATNIMTMGWHTVMEFSPSLIGCMITSANHSYRLIEKSGVCVINIPTADMLDTVIRIGNTTGATVDKFAANGLTPEDGDVVRAPLIRECYASFECRLADRRMLRKYNFFIFEIVKAHVAIRPRYPTTVHYRGEGIFMISGKNVVRARTFKPENL